MDISSVIYRGHEIVIMPNGKHLIHKDNRHGPLIDTVDTENDAKDQVDRIHQEARRVVD